MAVDAARAVPLGLTLRQIVPGQTKACHVEAARACVAQQQRRSLWMVHLYARLLHQHPMLTQVSPQLDLSSAQSACTDAHAKLS